MNILFSFSSKNQEQTATCVAVATILKTIGKTMFLCKDFSEKTNTVLSSNFDEYNYKNPASLSVVVAYTKLGLQQALSVVKQSNIPIVYILSSKEIETEYPNIMLVNKILIFGNTENVPLKMFRKDIAEKVHLLPPYNKETNNNKNKKGITKILIDNTPFNMYYSPSYWLAPLCNVLTNIEVTILYKETPMLPLFNTNVVLKDKTKINITDTVLKNDLVIGSADIISQAIIAKKPCIVVGEQGYGGLITAQNMPMQCKCNFQGRVGGYIGEYIPEHLLQDDIRKLISLKVEEQKEFTEENKKVFLEICKEFSEKWTSILSEVIEQEKLTKDLINCSLKLSSDFNLLPFPDDKFVLSYKETRQVHSNFGKEEASIILLFKKPIKVKDALEKSDYKEEKEMFLEFVQMLVNEKILMPYGN